MGGAGYGFGQGALRLLGVREQGLNPPAICLVQTSPLICYVSIILTRAGCAGNQLIDGCDRPVCHTKGSICCFSLRNFPAGGPIGGAQQQPQEDIGSWKHSWRQSKHGWNIRNCRPWLLRCQLLFFPSGISGARSNKKADKNTPCRPEVDNADAATLGRGRHNDPLKIACTSDRSGDARFSPFSVFCRIPGCGPGELTRMVSGTVGPFFNVLILNCKTQCSYDGGFRKQKPFGNQTFGPGQFLRRQ